MKNTLPTDKVDDIISQWQTQHPDFALKSMAILGRLQSCAAMLEPLLTAKFAEFGLNYGEFDVLATLRRSGEPFVLSPTELYSTLMITSGAITNRLKHLENKGLIERRPNPNDSRSLLVALTDEGKELIDQAFMAHLENENRLLEDLSDEMLENLNQGLKALLLAWGK
ncbi:MarR family transcriptional regulator [Pasteurellaceae bacterium RH1A]|nr:MarR family transcriptional regulator [Pasteurellaceae bacterium RH1A]